MIYFKTKKNKNTKYKILYIKHCFNCKKKKKETAFFMRILRVIFCTIYSNNFLLPFPSNNH